MPLEVTYDPTTGSHSKQPTRKRRERPINVKTTDGRIARIRYNRMYGTYEFLRWVTPKPKKGTAR